ncbi:adenylate/guanylate cyclase domain-containing protein [bacterium]|nr:adenylate/guanylate cyclase domain-containing protein [bacterium]
MKAPQFKAWLAILTLVAALVWLLTGWLAQWDARISDSWFGHPARRVKVDPRICLVLIDDKSLAALSTPMTFWAPHFAQVTSDLIRAGVAAVGLDWLPYDVDTEVFQAVKPFYPELGSVQDNPWLPLFLAIQDRPKNPMVQGIYPPNLQAKMMAPVAGMYEQYRPASELMAMLTSSQMGFLNLSRDRDGVLRRQAILPLALEQPLWGSTSYPPFAARLAEVSSQQMLEPKDPRWNGQPLPLTGDGTIRVAYPPVLAGISRYSFSDVLKWSGQPDLLRQKFAGKIVLIGAGTKIFQDLVQTPLGEKYGVEAHADVLNTLLTGQFIHEPKTLSRGLLAFLMIVVGAGLGLALSAPASLALVAGLEVTYYALVQSLFVQQSWLGPTLAPLLGGGLAWALSATWRARFKAGEERYVRQLFGRYVSPAVMEVLLKDPGQTALGMVGRRRITVLFSDINGFSGHCEKKSPEAIMTMLNDYFEHMNRILFRHGGTIKQFVGDEIMAMFGAPLEHPKAEEAAVLAAVEMTRHLESLRSNDPQEERGFYYIKIGIHSGEVILGNVGSHERTEYAAVGDDVNLGSRIMGMTKALQADILISREVYDQVRHLTGIDFVPKGAHPVKGRLEEVEIYQVLPHPAGSEGS